MHVCQKSPGRDGAPRRSAMEGSMTRPAPTWLPNLTFLRHRSSFSHIMLRHTGHCTCQVLGKQICCALSRVAAGTSQFRPIPARCRRHFAIMAEPSALPQALHNSGRTQCIVACTSQLWPKWRLLEASGGFWTTSGGFWRLLEYEYWY